MAIFNIQYANIKAKARITDKHPGKHGGICACGGRIIRSRTTKVLNRECWGCRYLKLIYGPNITIKRTM